MVKKYYVIKEESREVNGLSLEVNTDAPLENRVRIMWKSGTESIKFAGAEKNGDAFYKYISQDGEYDQGQCEDALGGLMGIPVFVEKGRAKTTKLKLTKKGKLVLFSAPKGVPIFLEQISAWKARDMVSDAKYNTLQRAFVYE